MSLRRAAVAALALLTAAPAVAGPAPSQLVIFGDSLVDSGNIFLATGGFAPTNVYNNPSRGYFPGRFTNGPDYTDLLSQKLYGHYTTPSLAGGSNYAFGGATYVANADPVPDLAAQLASYTGGHTVDPNALYIINLGGNDVFTLENPAFPAALIPAYEASLLNVLATTVQYLDGAGATRILVTGIPNTDAVGFALDGLVQAKLDAIQPGLVHADLLRFSYLSFFQQLSSNPAAFKVAPFTHLPSDGCFDHLSPPATADCSGYFSVDGVHPIAPIQRAIFQQIVQVAGVPEPASWALMIAGFGMLGTAARRGRALAA